MASIETSVTGVRLLKSQIEALKKLPPEITLSILVRSLLQEYLDGHLPQNLYDKIITEARRTVKIQKEVQSNITKINERRKAECQLKKTPLPLRFPLRNLELDQEP